MSPTSPTPAHKLGELKDNQLAAYLEDVFTIPVNLAGLPAISVPCGTAEEGGRHLPVGLQIIGKPLDGLTLLRVADAFEKGEGRRERKARREPASVACSSSRSTAMFGNCRITTANSLTWVVSSAQDNGSNVADYSGGDAMNYKAILFARGRDSKNFG